MLKSMSYKSLKDTQLKIIPTCFGSQRIHHQGVITSTLTEISCNGSQIFIVCVISVWQQILNLWCVCALQRRFRICRQTPTMHMIHICEALQVISVKVQVITP